MNAAVAYAPPAGVALGLLFLWSSLRLRRKRRLIDDLPTAKTQGVFIGLVELKGIAEAEAPLTAYLSGRRCVHYRYRVDEHWSRTVTETYTDKDGRARTRTRQESGWTTVADSGEITDFYLQDDTGTVLVRPEGAKIEPVGFFDVTCNRGDPLYYAKGPAQAVANSDHRRRFLESGVPLHAPLYVVGQARERADVIAPEIAADADAPMFLISTRTEARVRAGLGRGAWALTLLGGLAFLGGFALRTHAGLQRPLAECWLQYAGLAAVFAGLAAVGWVWMAYNGLVALRNRVTQAWSLVDVQLERRHDLIPRLVDTVAALRTHEASTQTALAALRNQLTATPPGMRGPDFSGCAPALRAVAEAYPDLKSDPAFHGLQKQLTETEQRIALACAYFNDIATFFNTRLQIVPDRWIAALGRMQPQALLAATDFERAAMTVRLAE
ncbi:MAG TPA: LemA family protein [Opitutaceae bacterium]|nr:LemA family protein [Opitutaceae bacterium]